MEVLASTDNTDNTSVTFWNPSSGTKLLTLRGPTAHPSSLCSISGEGFAVIETNKPFIHVWQCGQIQSSKRILCPGKPCALAIYPDGNYFAVAIEEKISIWQVCTGRIVTTVTSNHFRPVTVLKFNDNGSYLISGGQDGIVNAWNFLKLVSGSSSSPTYSWSDHSLPVSGIHVGSGGAKATVFTSSLDRTSKVYSLLSGTLLLSVSFPTALSAVAADTAEQSLYLGAKTGLIYQVKLQSPPRSVQQHILSEAAADFLFKKHSTEITGLSVSADGNILASSDEDGNIFLWDVASQQSIRTIQQAPSSHASSMNDGSAGPGPSSRKNKKVTNLMFWTGVTDYLQGSRKPKIHFPEVPKLLDPQDDGDNVVIKVWNRHKQGRTTGEEESAKTESRSALLAEISKLKMELVKHEEINNRLHVFCAENILGLQDKPLASKKRKI